ncbi:MAG: hypothetical protein ACYDE0_01335 [Acidiferrobacterales bacterium]
MNLDDLFPDRLEHHAKSTHPHVPLRDLAALLDHEALIMALVGADILANKTIDADDWNRLATAVRRIGKVRDHVHT